MALDIGFSKTKMSKAILLHTNILAQLNASFANDAPPVVGTSYDWRILLRYG